LKSESTINRVAQGISITPVLDYLVPLSDFEIVESSHKA